MRDARSVGSGRGVFAEAIEVMETTLTLTSAPGSVGRPESKPVAGRRAGNRGEAWGGVGSGDGHVRLDGESGGGSDEEMDSTDGGEKGREDETRSEERHAGQRYD